MADRHIFLHCFARGSVIEVIGRILKTLEENDNNNNISLHTFVQDTLSSFHITQIAFSTMQCFVFHQSELVRIIDAEFLKDGDNIFVCQPEDKQTLKKFLKKKEVAKEKLIGKMKMDDEEHVVSSTTAGSASRVLMGRNTMERLEYHLHHYKDRTYSK